MRTTRDWHENLIVAAGKITAMLLCCAAMTAAAMSQSLAGRWAATGRTLDNGEQERGILELKQTGNELTGTLRTLGFTAEIKGTATGNHFELYGATNPKRPVLTGDLVNGELHSMLGHRAWLAKL